MKKNNIMEVIETKNILLPLYIMKYYKKLNITEIELIFLYYLSSLGNDIPFNLPLFEKDLAMDTVKIMELISSLSDKKLLIMNVIKSEKGFSEEFISIAPFYNKIMDILLSDNFNNYDSTNIYSIIEKEFGRTLSPIEYETIKKWIDANISEELIKEALKEAILNGVNNLKYIDKILFEWTKKGYKTVKDIVKRKQKESSNVEIFDYDWLEDDEI